MCVCLSLYLFICKVKNGMQLNFMGGFFGDKENFGGDLDRHADCPIGNSCITQQSISGF